MHKHTGESGAIGAGLEAARLWGEGRSTRFIGLDAVARLQYSTRRDESTRCYFCKNKCLRTFIDVATAGGAGEGAQAFTYKQGPEEPHAARIRAAEERAPETQRIIIATCEKGTVEDVADMREIKRGLDAVKKANPNLVAYAAASAFASWQPTPAGAPTPGLNERLPWKGREAKRRAAAREQRARLRIGMPRVLNMYSLAPLFTAYFESLGLPAENLVWSDYTSEELYRAGAKRGAVDPCFPSKLGIPHVHNLLYGQARQEAAGCDLLPDDRRPAQRSPRLRGAPLLPHRGDDAGGGQGGLHQGERPLRRGGDRLPRHLRESRRAAALRAADLRRVRGAAGPRRSRRTRTRWRRATARSRASWPTSASGAPRCCAASRPRTASASSCWDGPTTTTPASITRSSRNSRSWATRSSARPRCPWSPSVLERLFGEDLAAGRIPDALSVADVWKNSYSENTSYKVFAAKYVARHPNLVALELSNFKCGHDAPIYALVEEIIEASGTPCFSFKDIDENKPAGSIKIRVETIDYFLRTHRESLVKQRHKRERVERELAELEGRLRGGEAAASEDPASESAAAASASRRAS